jgi:hypothetical protein
MQYAYHQIAEVQVLSVDCLAKHEKMTTVSDILFKDDGSRNIQISRRTGNIWSVTYTMEDEEVINNLQPFALTEKELPEYALLNSSGRYAANIPEIKQDIPTSAFQLRNRGSSVSN